MNKIEELLVDLEEVRAYKALQGVPFDFGTGVVRCTLKNSEDPFYDTWEQEIIKEIELLKTEEKEDVFVGMQSPVKQEKVKKSYRKKNNRKIDLIIGVKK